MYGNVLSQLLNKYTFLALSLHFTNNKFLVVGLYWFEKVIDFLSNRNFLIDVLSKFYPVIINTVADVKKV